MTETTAMYPADTRPPTPPQANDSFTRWAPITGLLFVALVVVGGLALQGSTPAASTSGRAVIAFYTAHHTRQRAGAVLITLSFVALLFFVGALRARWSRFEGNEAWATVALAATAVLVAGQTANASMTWALTDSPTRLAPSAAQTLNVLSNDLVLTSAAGFLSLGLAAGIVIVRGAGLPAWLGWAAIAIGIAFVTPIEFLAFLLLLVWVIAVTVLTLRTSPSTLVR